MNIRNALLSVLAVSNLLVPSIVSARFMYPPASFFQPMSHLTRSGLTDILPWLNKNKDYDTQTFGMLLVVAGIEQQLSQEPLTLFVPTDKAFTELSPQIRQKLAQPAKLKQLIKYHLTNQLITEADIKREQVTTLEGNSVRITGEPRGSNSITVKLNDAVARDAIGLKENKQVLLIIIDRVLIPANF